MFWQENHRIADILNDVLQSKVSVQKPFLFDTWLIIWDIDGSLSYLIS